jgi:sarcosine oxidase subunit beta
VLQNGEEVACGNIVCAAGAWSREIGMMDGLKIPIVPQRGQLIITEQVEISEYQYVLDADYLTSAYGLEVEGEDASARERFRMGIGASYAQEPTGNWTVGSSRDDVGFDTATTPEVLKTMAGYLMKFLPSLRDANGIRFIAGCRPHCEIDGLPIIGGVPGLQGFYMAAGHGGEGVGLAPITGKLIAEEITTGGVSPLLQNFRHQRFAGGRI